MLSLIPSLVLAEPLKFPESASNDNIPSASVEQGRRDATSVIEEILSAARSGRSVGITLGNTDLDTLAKDPELKKTLEGSSSSSVQGRSNIPASAVPDDVQARNYVTNKLCSLGLAKCGQKRNYGGVDGIRDVTLVQPVALKPIGQPIAAIPLSNSGRPFSHKSYDRQYGSETQGGFIQSGNFGCTCVPVSQCNSYDIVSGSNNYPVPYNPTNNGNGNRYPPTGGNFNNYNNNNFNNNYNGNNNYNNGNNNFNNQFITGNGRPSYGQVGQGIDPRNKLESTIESNATVVDARAVPESAKNTSRVRRDVPRVVNGASQGCYDRQVCCRNPVGRPVDRNPSGNNYPTYPSNNFNGNGNNNNYPSPNNNNNGGGCGRRNAYGINGRVLTGVQGNYGIGNGDTEFGEYPWQVAILRKEGGDNVFVCGGSLIDSRHVLTAAHCIQSHRPQILRVRLGDWDVGGETEFYQHQDLDVAAIALHPDFNSGNLFNDIAIVKLDGNVNLRQGPHISPICLPDKYTEFQGRRCIVTGWGNARQRL